MLIAEGHGWPAGNLILRQKACSSIIPDGWRSLSALWPIRTALSIES
jgi:hypothetical protein